jgi:hypothetical protein
VQLNPAQPTRALPFFTVPPRLRHIQVQHAACTPRTCCMHASHMLHARSAHADAVDTQRCHIQMPAHSRGEIFGAAILFTAPPRLRHIRVQHAACTPRTCCMHAAHMLTRSIRNAVTYRCQHTAEVKSSALPSYSTACARHTRAIRESSRLLAPAPDHVSDVDPSLDSRQPLVSHASLPEPPSLLYMVVRGARLHVIYMQSRMVV